MHRTPRLLIVVLSLAVVSFGGRTLAHAAPPAQILPPSAPAAAPTAEPAVTADPKATQPPDAKTIRATVDAALSEHLAKLQSFESDYKADGKRNYFQTLISHSQVPADGQTLPPDKLAAGPTDQAGQLSDFWSDAQLAAQLPYAFRTDVYDGPEGAGYVLTVQVKIGGELWEKSTNVGPERWRDSDWHALVVDKP
jgi:hypothetical protein